MRFTRIFIVAILVLSVSCKKQEKKPSLEEISSIVYLTRGDVKVWDKSNQEIPVKPQVTKILSGYTIQTEEKSSMDLLLYDGSFVRIFPDTKITVSSEIHSTTGESDSKIKIATGKVFVKVGKLPKNRNIEVHTSTTVAGVRGTEFMVVDEPPMPDAPPAPSKILVNEGSVEGGSIDSDERLIVEEGQKLDYVDNEFVVEEMTPEEKSELESESQSVASIVENGKQEIQAILDRFKEEKQQILEHLDKQKDNDSRLLQEQKDKDSILIEEQKRKNADLMEGVKGGTEREKDSVKEKTKSDMDAIKSGNKSEMDRIREGMKNP